MSEPRVVCYFANDITVGDICLLFHNNTSVYDYRLIAADDAVVLVEGP